MIKFEQNTQQMTIKFRADSIEKVLEFIITIEKIRLSIEIESRIDSIVLKKSNKNTNFFEKIHNHIILSICDRTSDFLISHCIKYISHGKADVQHVEDEFFNKKDKSKILNFVIVFDKYLNLIPSAKFENFISKL